MDRTIRVTPERWLTKGETMVQQRRQALVLWKGIVGEEAEFRIVHKGQNQTHGAFSHTETPSKHRVEPPCDRYDPCGGCPMMHVDAAGQRQAHIDRVRHALDEARLRDVAIDGYTPSPHDRDFRHVVKVGWGWNHDKTRIKVGAFGRRDRRIVPIPHCLVASPVLNRVMTSLAHHAIQLGIEPYDPLTDKGVMRAAVIRASRTTGEVLLTLIAGRRPRLMDDLVERVVQENSPIVGVFLHRNTEPGNALYHPDEDGSIRMKRLSGRSWIEEDLDGIQVRVGPGDFYQTHPELALPLYERALERLDLGSKDAFVDLYCGVGGLTMLGARRCQLAIGVEQVQGAVLSARDSAKRNGLRCEFVAGDVLDVLPSLSKRLKHPMVAVDPSRRGLHPEIVQALIEMKPRRLVYISCNARTLARDLALFREGGANLESVELFDLFPHTAHVECLTTLSFPVESGRAPRRKLVRR